MNRFHFSFITNTITAFVPVSQSTTFVADADSVEVVVVVVVVNGLYKLHDIDR